MVLIDSNRTPSRDSPARDNLQSLGAESLAFVCITHPDKDHYAGIFDVFTAFCGRISKFYTFPVGDLVTSNRLKKLSAHLIQLARHQDDPEFTRRSKELVQIFKFADEHFLPDDWEQLVGQYNVMNVPGFPDVEFCALMPPGRVKGDFFASIDRGTPQVDTDLDANKVSIGLLLRYAGVSVLLGGDCPVEEWQFHSKWARGSPLSVASSVVKLPHHGSRRDCTEDVLMYLIDAAEAEDARPLAIISASGKRHPSREVLEWLIENKVQPYCTNWFSGWNTTAEIRRLLTTPNVDPLLVRALAEYADQDLTIPTPCKGDITVTVHPNGNVQVETEGHLPCECDPVVRELMSALS